MLMSHVDHYLAIRRGAGFALEPIAGYLRSFARFATQRGEPQVVATTAIDWAKLAPAEAQRHYRLQTVRRFARFMAAEDPHHQIPPAGLFRGHRQRPIPYIFSETEIAHLLSAARHLGPAGSLEVYLRAAPTEKLEALESIMPPALRRGQFTVPDKVIASLRGE